MNELFAALSRAQGKVENAKKASSNPHFRSKYADLAEVWGTIREPFTSEGLAIVQFPCEATDGRIGLRTVITHSSGQSIEERFSMGLKDASNPQAAGSCLTYMKRYSLMSVAGIGSEDDDANAATGRPGVPVARVAAETTDWSAVIVSTLTKLGAATDEGQRQLYADVRNGSLPEAVKNKLLTQMGTVIKARLAAATKTNGNKKESK